MAEATFGDDRLTLTDRARSSLDAFIEVGGTPAMYEGEPCLTITQAQLLGALLAYQRVLYEFGMAPGVAPTRGGDAWTRDFADMDREYREYV